MTTDPGPRRRAPLPVPIAVDEAREAAIARLTDSFARDEISMVELEARLASAYDATTLESLASLTADLPVPVPSVAPLAPLRLEAKLSNLVRGGPLALPPRVQIRALLGNVELDWRGAEIQPGVTEVEVRNLLGNVEIRLPAHVRVEHQGSAFMGSFECRQAHAEAPAPAGSHSVLRFIGRTTLGSVTVRLG